MVGWDQGCAFHHMLLECVTGQVTGRTLGRDSELFESHGGLAIKRHNNIMRFGMIYEWSYYNAINIAFSFCKGVQFYWFISLFMSEKIY